MALDDRLITDAALTLRERLARLPSRGWAEDFLMLVGLLLGAAALADDDPRIVTSLPKEGPYPLPVTINNRYVLAPCYRKGHWTLGFVYGPEYEFQPEVAARTRCAWRFTPHRNEGLDTPFWLVVSSPNRLLTDAGLREGWLEACLAELPRAQASANRRSHVPLFARAAREEPYRRALLQRAFQDS